jgi:hypothetical protein
MKELGSSFRAKEDQDILFSLHNYYLKKNPSEPIDRIFN